MTAAEMVSALQSLVDENTTVAPFYVNAQDYYDALNTAQLLLLEEYTGGAQVNWRAVRNMIVSDTGLSDGSTLANPCFKPLLTLDPTNFVTSAPVDPLLYRGYRNISTVTNFVQVEVEGNGTVHLIPSTATGITLYYLTFPADISVSQDCQFAASVHPAVVMKALEILIHKDIDAPYTEMIDTERNRTELLKQKTGIPQAPDIPYQSQR